MNWEAIGAVGEITGAAAVVVTLGYLARQIRQSMAAAKTDSRQRVLDRYSDVLTPEARAALDALAPFNKDRLAVMAARCLAIMLTSAISGYSPSLAAMIAPSVRWKASRSSCWRYRY